MIVVGFALAAKAQTVPQLRAAIAGTTQFKEHPIAIPNRHIYVGNYQVWKVLQDECHAILAIGSAQCVEAFKVKPFGNALEDRRFVFNNQYFDHV